MTGSICFAYFISDECGFWKYMDCDMEGLVSHLWFTCTIEVIIRFGSCNKSFVSMR